MVDKTFRKEFAYKKLRIFYCIIVENMKGLNMSVNSKETKLSKVLDKLNINKKVNTSAFTMDYDLQDLQEEFPNAKYTVGFVGGGNIEEFELKKGTFEDFVKYLKDLESDLNIDVKEGEEVYTLDEDVVSRLAELSRVLFVNRRNLSEEIPYARKVLAQF